MRSPLDSVRLDCGINRISVSHGNRPILAVPLDNRHVKLYDLTGTRLAHLPRRQRQVGNTQKPIQSGHCCAKLKRLVFFRLIVGWYVVWHGHMIVT